MTPKEKARELVDKMRDDLWEQRCIKIYLEDAQLCALIAINEIIKELTEEISPSVHGFRHKYWQEVKQEIKNL